MYSVGVFFNWIIFIVVYIYVIICKSFKTVNSDNKLKIVLLVKVS